MVIVLLAGAESTILGSLDENTIGALDPEKAMLLRPWLQLSHTTELPAHFADSFWQHVVLHFDTEVCRLVSSYLTMTEANTYLHLCYSLQAPGDVALRKTTCLCLQTSLLMSF